MTKLKHTMHPEQKTHILNCSIEAPHHHLYTVRHLLGVSLKIQ